MSQSDWLDVVIELEELTRRMGALRHRVGEIIGGAARPGGATVPTAGSSLAPLAIPAATHAFAEIRQSGVPCFDDPPGSDA